jgi:hypothetical protein
MIYISPARVDQKIVANRFMKEVGNGGLATQNDIGRPWKAIAAPLSAK